MLNKFKKSIKMRLLTLTILPITLLSIILSLTSTFILKKNMINDAQNQLKSTAYTTYELLSNNEITLDDSNHILLNNQNIENQTSIPDAIKKNTGVDITIFNKDTRISTSLIDKNGKRILGTKASDVVIESVLNREENYFDPSINIEGTDYLGCYIPLYDKSDKIVGIVFAGKDKNEYYSIVNKNIFTITLISIILTTITIIVSFLSSNRISKYLKTGSVFLNNVSKGNLNSTIDKNFTKRQDELGSIINEALNVQENLKSIISNAKKASTKLTLHSDTINTSTKDCLDNANSINKSMNLISSDAINQLHSTENATTKITQIGNLIKDISNNINILDASSNEISNSEKEANKIITDSKLYNQVTIDAVEKIKVQVNKTNECANKINEATIIITDIANETNLLSLNASIEAARAGELGKGFAVVAEEIQKLAEESNKSAVLIQEIISNLLKESSNTVMATDSVQEAITNQKIKINETKEKFDIVSNGIMKTIDSIHLISEETENLSMIKNEIVDIIDNLSATSKENVASTEETNNSMNKLSDIVNNLSNLSEDLSTISNDLDNSICIFSL